MQQERWFTLIDAAWLAAFVLVPCCCGTVAAPDNGPWGIGSVVVALTTLGALVAVAFSRVVWDRVRTGRRPPDE